MRLITGRTLISRSKAHSWTMACMMAESRPGPPATWLQLARGGNMCLLMTVARARLP